MKKSLLALVMSMLMILSLSACGGGSSDSGSGEAAPAAEPNAGIAGVVFAVPDGWSVSDVGTNYVNYVNPDSPYELSISTTTQADLDEMQGMDGYKPEATIKEEFEKNYVPNDKSAKKNGYDYENVKICDGDGYIIGYTEKSKGHYSMSASWVYEDIIYSLYMSSMDNYDNNGNLTDKAVPLTADEEAMFKGVVASIQPGDGDAYKSSGLATEIGPFSYTVPEGFTLESASKEFATITKNDSDITLTLNRTDEKTYAEMEMDEKPATLEEYYKQLAEDSEKTTVAGYEGFINKSEEEDGSIYGIWATFLAEDGMYDINMDCGDVYDDNGNVKEGSVPLSEDDIAAFNSVVASINKK